MLILHGPMARSPTRQHLLQTWRDLRFVNEAIALADYGFIIIRLNFPDEEFQRERLMRAYPEDWERHWNARNDISETEIRAIPSDMIDLEITVEDGDTNWLAMIEHLWLT